MGSKMVLKFDANGIRRSAAKFNDYSEQMHTLQTQLKKSLENLQSRDWQGKASDKLVEILGTNWSATVDRYCDLMKVLTAIMNDASATYDQLLEEAKCLKLDA